MQKILILSGLVLVLLLALYWGMRCVAQADHLGIPLC